MGIKASKKAESKYRIIGIPLDLFSNSDGQPIQYQNLRQYAEGRNHSIYENSISVQPNGIVCDENDNSVFYTYEALDRVGSWFKIGKGHIGKMQADSQQEDEVVENLTTPNGIDIDRSTDHPTLIVSMTFNNSIHRFVPIDSSNSYKEASSININTSKDNLFGDLPDGVFCMEKGDVFVACFGSGKVLYIPKKDNEFGDAKEVEGNLGNPTDCVIGPSSNGDTTSLFVTTKQAGIIAFKPIAKGNVIEITDIEKKIEISVNG